MIARRSPGLSGGAPFFVLPGLRVQKHSGGAFPLGRFLFGRSTFDSAARKELKV